MKERFQIIPAVYCPSLVMGEKPSPLGEDFSLTTDMTR